MNRRTFLKSTMVGGIYTAIGDPSRLLNVHEKRMERIGMSTVNFRNRFLQTADQKMPIATELTLMEVPQYFAERFKIHNVEYWSRHFESTSPTYLKTLKSAIKRNNSKLINIQLDENYQIADPDASKREESIELALHWVDVAKKLGSGGLRVNPGKGKPEHAIEALKIINQEAKKQGIILMTENHFGMEMDPDLHLKIVSEVGENMYTLPDYGNFSEEVRYKALAKILPYAYQVSAKTAQFDQNMNHISFDFERCMKLAIDSGFKGIYSVEQWHREPLSVSDEAMADWMISKVKSMI